MLISEGQGDSNVDFVQIEVKSIQALADVMTSGSYSLGTFKDNYRNIANFIQAKAIGLDFDEGLTLDEAKEQFKDYAHIIAPSRSHQKPKRNPKTKQMVTCDRFRVILILTEEIKDEATFAATWFSLAAKWPSADPACKDPARFFYASTEIVSISAAGLRIAPVEPPEVEPWTAGQVDVPTWLKGKLAKTTMDFLDKGTLDETGRNNTVHKVARDFNQALYSEEEASEIIMDALKKHDIIASDFPEREAETAIGSAFAKEAKHPPRVETKAFKWRSIEQFNKEAKPIKWMVEDLLSEGGISIIVGPPKSGKSTIIRQIAKAVCRGDKFFGRQCKQGSVLHIALEEQEGTVKDQYKKVGVIDSDPLFLHVGGVYAEHFLDDLKTDILAAKPVLLIVDTLFLLSPVESSNDYSQVNAAMTPYRNLARETNTHILFVHHTRKGVSNGAESIAGSIGIHGAVDCALMLSQLGQRRTIESSQRGGNPFPKSTIEFDAPTQTYTLGKELEEFE